MTWTCSRWWPGWCSWPWPSGTCSTCPPGSTSTASTCAPVALVTIGIASLAAVLRTGDRPDPVTDEGAGDD